MNKNLKNALKIAFFLAASTAYILFGDGNSCPVKVSQAEGEVQAQSRHKHNPAPKPKPKAKEERGKAKPDSLKTKPAQTGDESADSTRAPAAPQQRKPREDRWWEPKKKEITPDGPDYKKWNKFIMKYRYASGEGSGGLDKGGNIFPNNPFWQHKFGGREISSGASFARGAQAQGKIPRFAAGRGQPVRCA